MIISAAAAANQDCGRLAIQARFVVFSLSSAASHCCLFLFMSFSVLWRVEVRGLSLAFHDRTVLCVEVCTKRGSSNDGDDGVSGGMRGVETI
jgi:hypothetical protein